MFGSLSCHPVTVTEALELPHLHDTLVSVHGLLYAGEGCQRHEMVLLEKPFPFDGSDFEGRVKINHKKAIAITHPNLHDRFNSALVPGACGSFLYRYDVIIVGRLQQKKHFEYAATLDNLVTIILQRNFNWPPNPLTGQLHIINFDSATLSQLPVKIHHAHSHTDDLIILPLSGFNPDSNPE